MPQGAQDKPRQNQKEEWWYMVKYLFIQFKYFHLSLVIDIDKNSKGNTCQGVYQQENHHILPLVFRAEK